MKRTGAIALLFLTSCGGGSSEGAQHEAWVNVDRLNRRTCPGETCGVVGQYFLRDQASVFEEQDGWARVSRYYAALCEDGRNEYVDTGNDRCDLDNEVVDGRFAEWVAARFLLRGS